MCEDIDASGTFASYRFEGKLKKDHTKSIPIFLEYIPKSI